MRENRVPKNCPLQPVKQIKKTVRGTYDYALTDDKKIVITRWMDNSVVTVASTVHGVQPVTNALRYSSKEKKKIGIPRPYCIGKYNEFMGGTDQMDANINVYRIGIRGKKWWWPIFTWLLDSCI
ncbi:piggyBac transposable element-derived protein 3-like [Sitophilus oryzae]|uniref:PiggyBac transposable element-derived protein 3-like n=1 Tax=Sitophilus oryzae TaxID=7048 RepID=A0A6J2YHA3_SITOR|nr:piggyBac transposable element-derived protein 3-like [Sitophilus oryzae]